MTSNELRGIILQMLHAEWQKTGIIFVKVTARAVVERTGAPLLDVSREAHYLGLKGLLKDLASGQAFCPTVPGIDFVEHKEKFPEYQGLIFLSAGGDITVTGSQIGGAGNTQLNESGWAPANVLALIAEIREGVQRETNESLRQQLLADLVALDAQCRRPAKSDGVVKEIWNIINTSIQTSSSLAALMPQLRQVGQLLGVTLGAS
jgi:hypothetical protein